MEIEAFSSKVCNVPHNKNTRRTLAVHKTAEFPPASALMKEKEEESGHAPVALIPSDTVVSSRTDTAQGFDSFTQLRHARVTRIAQDWAFQLFHYRALGSNSPVFIPSSLTRYGMFIDE